MTGDIRKAQSCIAYKTSTHSLVGAWVLCLGVWFGVPSQHQWWLLECGAGGDARCSTGLVGAPGVPLWRVGALSCCRCTWVCAVLGGCRRGVAGCCVLCFLFCACVPLLTVCMLCGSYLCSSFFSATPDACSALCLVLHCTALLDVSKSHNIVAKYRDHTPEILDRMAPKAIRIRLSCTKIR